MAFDRGTKPGAGSPKTQSSERPKDYTGQNPEHVAELVTGPVLLSVATFTPLTRTPWAGKEIGRRYKDELVPGAAGTRIGESWEFSCDPAFPSWVEGKAVAPGLNLEALVAAAPTKVLSSALAERSGGRCELLVKLINAAEPLSLQVHPQDNDPSLSPGECGKPESWLVLHAEPGAGLYLGFTRALSRQELAALLVDGDAAKRVLQFVPVKANDYFEIMPGVPHAIGSGVTILEPQRVRFGQSGKTLRLWDWGRRYDAAGKPDQSGGRPRELHVDAGLRLISPESQVGEDFVRSTRRSPSFTSPAPGVTVARFPANADYQLSRVGLVPGASLRLMVTEGYAALITLGGKLRAIGANGAPTVMAKGQPALLPHAAMPLAFDSESGGDFALIVPASAQTHWY